MAVPVPADYAGARYTPVAVFRAGAWYIDGQSPRFLGLAGDLPLDLPYAIRDRHCTNNPC